MSSYVYGTNSVNVYTQRYNDLLTAYNMPNTTNPIDLLLMGNNQISSSIFDMYRTPTFISSIDASIQYLSALNNQRNSSYQVTAATGSINSNIDSLKKQYEAQDALRPKWSFDANGNLIETQNDANGNKVKDTIYTSAGKKIREISYDSNGRITNDTLYNTDSSVNHTESRTYNADGSYKSSITDNSGNIVNDTYINANGKKTRETTYDSNQKLSKDVTYNADGTVKESTSRTYNADGSYKASTTDGSGKLLNNTYADTNGKKTEDINYNTSGKVSSYVTYNTDGTVKNTLNGELTKDNLNTYLKNTGLKSTVDANLVDYQEDNMIQSLGGVSGKVSSDTLYSDLDVNKDGSVDKSEIDGFFSKITTASGNLNNSKAWNADGGYGYIDWNNDGKFGNDGGTQGSYANFLAVHGDLDNFFTKLGSYWQVKNLKGVVDGQDNKTADKDSRAGFVSDGVTTAHKISDSQYGFNITAHDQSKSAGVNYNYAVYDINRNAYIIGNDQNNDGFLKDGEIMGIVNNIGSVAKTSSPLTFDLNGNGKVDTTAIEKEYDLNGDGKVDKTAWAGLGDGVLAFDANNDGTVGQDGKEIFGNNTDVDGDGKADGFDNGFDALKALAEKLLGSSSISDGKLDTKEILALQAKANLSMLVDGQQKSLIDLGITEISLGYTNSDSVDANGNQHRQIGEGFVMNGQQRKVNDVWFQYV